MPPQSGAYTFALRSDDSSQLYLSSDDTPDNKTLLLREDACCRSFDANASGPVTLEAGRRYYIEGLMKEGGGPDYLYVAWKTPDNQATWVVIPGSSLGGYLAATNTTLGIAKQPTNLVGMLAGLTATFSEIGRASGRERV